MNTDITLNRTAHTISLDIFVGGFSQNPGFRRWQLASGIDSFSNFPIDFIRNTIKTTLWMVHPYRLCSNAFSHTYSWEKLFHLYILNFLLDGSGVQFPALFSMKDNVLFSKQTFVFNWEKWQSLSYCRIKISMQLQCYIFVKTVSWMSQPYAISYKCEIYRCRGTTCICGFKMALQICPQKLLVLIIIFTPPLSYTFMIHLKKREIQLSSNVKIFPHVLY